MVFHVDTAQIQGQGHRLKSTFTGGNKRLAAAGWDGRPWLETDPNVVV